MPKKDTARMRWRTWACPPQTCGSGTCDYTRSREGRRSVKMVCEDNFQLVRRRGGPWNRGLNIYTSVADTGRGTIHNINTTQTKPVQTKPESL